MLKKILALIIALCLFLMLNTGLISAETLSTDVFNNAIPLKFDSTDELSEAVIKDELNNQDDAKFYSIDMEQNGELYFFMQQNLSVEFGVSLYTASGEKLEKNFTTTGDKEQNLFGQGLLKGTYYIKIYTNKGTGVSIPFQLNVMRYYGDNIELERNNTLETATPIKIDQSYFGYTDQENTEDLYRFTTIKSGVMNIKGTISGHSPLIFRLLDEKGEIVGEDVINANGKFTISSILTRQINQGTYYISVSAKSGENTVSNEGYEFQTLFIDNILFEKESNNSMKQANSIKLNSVYYGLLNQKKDKDLYKFYTTNSKSISLSFTKLPNTVLRVRVFNSKGRMVKTYTTKNGEETIVKLGDFKLAKGTYYLDVGYLQGESENVLYNFSLK